MYTLEQARELLRNRRPEEALARFGARLPSAGDPAWIVIAEAWLRLGRPGEARASLGRAPATLDAGLVAVSVLEFEGRFTEARASLMALPPVPAVLLRRGNLGLRTADLDWAGESFTEALAGEPGLVEGLVGRALVLDRRGLSAAAARSLDTIVARGNAPVRIVWAWATAMVRVDPDRVVGPLHEALPRASLNQQGQLLHVLGRATAARGEYRQAFEAYQAANSVRYVPFDGDAFYRGALRTAAQTRQPIAGGSLTQRTPILVVGAPRSGTTLVETLLCQHPEIAAAGELQTGRLLALDVTREHGGWTEADLTPAQWDALGRRYLAALEPFRGEGGASRVIDKTPGNALLLGFFAAMVPGLTVIHCVRDPHDTAWSCFRQHFGPSLGWATSLDGIGAWMRTERMLMRHWAQTLSVPVIEVAYEDVVADPERALRPAITAAGLPWDPAVADYRGGRMDAATASWAEVRQGLHDRSVGRSAPYRRWMRDFEQAFRGEPVGGAAREASGDGVGGESPTRRSAGAAAATRTSRTPGPHPGP